MRKSLFILALCSATTMANEVPFTLDGELGFITTTGNTETTSLAIGVNSKHETIDWSNEYKFSGLYKQDTVENDGVEETNTTAQKLFISAQANYKLANENRRIFGFGSFEDDRFSSYEYQATIAAGWNEKFWDDKQSSLNASVGPGYTLAKLAATDEDRNSMVLRVALDYSYSLSENARLTQKFASEYGEFNTKSKSETAVAATLMNDIKMKVSLKLDHNTDVAAGRSKLDSETAVTLVYTFF